MQDGTPLLIEETPTGYDGVLSRGGLPSSNDVSPEGLPAAGQSRVFALAAAGGMTRAESRTMARKKAVTSKNTGKDGPAQEVVLVYKADPRDGDGHQGVACRPGGPCRAQRSQSRSTWRSRHSPRPTTTSPCPAAASADRGMGQTAQWPRIQHGLASLMPRHLSNST